MEKGTPKIQTLTMKTVINLLNILHSTPEDDEYNYAQKTILTPHPIHIHHVAQIKTSQDTTRSVSRKHQVLRVTSKPNPPTSGSRGEHGARPGGGLPHAHHSTLPQKQIQ